MKYRKGLKSEEIRNSLMSFFSILSSLPNIMSPPKRNTEEIISRRKTVVIG